MKQLVRSFLAITLLTSAAMMADCNDNCNSNNNCNNNCSSDCSSNNCDTDCNSSTTSCGKCHSVYIPRSTNSNTAYFFLPFAHKADMDTWYAGMELGVEYQRSFKDKDIAKALFGTETLKFQGSQIADRDSSALLADYFGLSPFTDSSLSLKPRIENVNLHFQSYLGMDCWLEGLYGQVNFTFTHQKRELRSCNNSCTSTVTTDTQVFPAGYMDAVAVTPTTDIKTALGGDNLFGDMQTAWNYGRFNFCDMTENKVAGVDLILGYDFWRNDCSHFGAYFMYVAPTGNKPCAKNVFSPVVGNGKHHEIGGGLQGHWKLWDGNCDDSITAYFDGNITTALKNHQDRSFDFKNSGCMSRYMLLKELVSTTSTVGFAYDGTLINAINWTTRCVDVKIPVKGDATLRFVYKRGCFDFGLGYNFYGQSHEKIGCNLDKFPCNNTFANKHYGKKGCNGTDYFTYLNTAGAFTFEETLALNATSSNAAISGATPCGTTDNPVDASVNPAISGGIVAVDYTAPFLTNGLGVEADSLEGLITDVNVIDQAIIPHAFLSVPAVEVTSADLDKKSAESPKQISSKGFATMNYTWTDCDWTPYLGLGAEVEGGSHETLKQWGVWIKGGISF